MDLAKKMIELSGKKNIQIEIIGLRSGEKLYEELLIDDSNINTKYEFITIAKPTYYDINKLNQDIKKLINFANIDHEGRSKEENQLRQLKKIVPEFNHKPN